MIKQSKNIQCSLCKKKRKLNPENEQDICNSCTNLIDLIKENPDVLKRFAELSNTDLTELKSSIQDNPELPEVLDGVRYRTVDRERNTWYVSVSEIEGNPVEIFASTAFENDQHLQSRISNLTTITRLVSLILRHVFMGEHLTLEKTLTQLNRSSRQPNDLPEMLGRILSNYRAEEKGSEEKEETYIP